ncbi:MAG TPA: flagellar basal body P-ring protein FlgI [Terracidiphilus sp.]|jgi:flagellar P-ring protein precursor FlgI|nr:flagellar basal body P-ring protein FlgI [Terracidiphilus sp.]
MKRIFSNLGLWLRSIAWALTLSGIATLLVPVALADNPNRHVLVRDITSVQGVRDNMLVGYGLVVGLNRTGDSQQTYFTVQTLANAMQRMGVLISPGVVQVKNVAAVFITASLPPFARPGEKLDVTVSSAGDAKSLEGGILLMSALHGPDGQVYAEAQGPLVVGGYSAGTGSNSKQLNSPTVGVVSNGAIVERDTAVDLHDFKTVSLLLRNPDFTTARQIADAINQDFHKPVASALDSTRVDVSVPDAAEASVPVLISRVQNLALNVHTPARIVINERTGTIVLGGDVKLTPVSVIHGNLSIQVVTSYAVAPLPVTAEVPLGGGRGPRRDNSPGAAGPGGPDADPQNQNRGAGGGGGFLAGQAAALVPETTVTANDSPAQTMRLDEGANVEELVNGLHAIGTTARDVVAILQAIKAEGGLQADLEVQ